MSTDAVVGMMDGVSLPPFPFPIRRRATGPRPSYRKRPLHQPLPNFTPLLPLPLSVFDGNGVNRGVKNTQAYFVSRNEILSFLNGLLDMNLTKIEETASGAVACQLTEYIFPGSVPMSKVNWGGAFVLGDVSATDRAPAYFRRGHSFSHPARMTMTIHMVRSTLLCLSNPCVTWVEQPRRRTSTSRITNCSRARSGSTRCSATSSEFFLAD